MQNIRKVDIEAPEELGPDSETQLMLPLPVGLADGSEAEVPSPARTLQQRLIEDLAAEAEGDDGYRWAPRTTLLFSVGASLALWAAIAVGIAVFR
jgi:hypothetical protein